jgi:hypothetical protein
MKNSINLHFPEVYSGARSNDRTEVQELPLKQEAPSFLLMINLNKVQIHQLRGRAALLPLNKPPSHNV